MIIRSYKNFLESKHHGSDYKYACVMIYLDIPNWNDIISFIKPEDIYKPEDPSRGIETDPHLTVFYGLHSDISDDIVKGVIDKIDGQKMNLNIDGIGVFENKEFDVVKFNIESEYLHQVNKMFGELPHTSDYPDYKPHVTIAYVKSGTGKNYINDLFKYNIPSVSRIVYSKCNDDKIDFSI